MFECNISVYLSCWRKIKKPVEIQEARIVHVHCMCLVLGQLRRVDENDPQ